jgi:release factor glutamine methyltransferase
VILRNVMSRSKDTSSIEGLCTERRIYGDEAPRGITAEETVIVEFDLDTVTARLVRAGFVAARDEAEELFAYSHDDDTVLESMIERRLRGEPLAWITGFTTFCGMKIRVDHGVYEPRWQSEPLARAAVERLPSQGTAIDLCTGSGAIAKALLNGRPSARVVASDLDEHAVRCARSNGVDVYHGDLFAPLPQDLEGRVDVIVGVVPYVPRQSLTLLPRDTFIWESPVAYDGGGNGLDVLGRVLEESPRFLRSGGCLLVELGGEQAELLRNDLARLRFKNVRVLKDDDGDVRGLEATLSG